MLLMRSKLADWYRRNRERSATLLALIDDEAFYDRPIPLRHPFAFYEGHIPAFSFSTLCDRGLGGALDRCGVGEALRARHRPVVDG